MIQEGQIVLFRFPQTDQGPSALRPALLIRQLPGPYGDWLMCMITTRLYQEIQGIDMVLKNSDNDFADTGLKAPSLVRITRLAVVAPEILRGAIGRISPGRLQTIRRRISDWVLGKAQRV